jgi:hypothetical protein
MAVTTLEAAVAALQTLTLALTGMREAPALLTEVPQVFPCSRAYPWEGTWTGMGGGWKKSLATIALDVHVARRDMRRDIDTLYPFVDSVGNMLAANPTLSTTVQTIVYPVTWSFRSFTWDAQGSVITLGFRFLIPVKLETVNT